MVRNCQNVVKEHVRELSKKYNIVIVCGGFGVMPNDTTPLAVANACSRKLEENTLAVGKIVKMLPQVNINQYKQAFILPEDITVLDIEDEPLSAFMLENIFVVPMISNFTKVANILATGLQEYHMDYITEVLINNNSLEGIMEFATQNPDIKVYLTQKNHQYIAIIVTSHLSQKKYYEKLFGIGGNLNM